FRGNFPAFEYPILNCSNCSTVANKKNAQLFENRNGHVVPLHRSAAEECHWRWESRHSATGVASLRNFTKAFSNYLNDLADYLNDLSTGVVQVAMGIASILK
ncbi:MAG: hypothetical protein J5797_07265, partial [Prevotella sp.]|nr:hypothetical protein [Prevotella sp.]